MRRPSPALVIAMLALVVALGGTAVAAKRYVISTTTQISPKVLASLRKAGPPGPVGLTGPAGQNGEAGATGPQGPAGPSSIVSLSRSSAMQIASPSEVGRLSALPPGNWLVVAALDATAALRVDLTCELTAPAGIQQPGATVTVPATPDRTQLTTSATFVLVAAASDVALDCTYPGGAAPSVDNLRLSAIRTADLDRRFG